MAKTYKEWEDEAKKSGYYDTFSDEDLNQIKGDVAYGDNMLAGKKRYDAAETPEEKAAIADEFANERLQRGYYNTVQGDGKGGYRATSTTAASLGGGTQSASKFNTVNRLLAEIAGDKFSYDAKNDKRYKLAEEYAERAMANQMAESALLTGGYGNSYAAAAGQQVYTDYMNDAVNDMEDRAYAKWAAERDNKYNLLSIARDMEQQKYDREQTERQWQYQAQRDAIEDAWRDKEWEYGVARDEKSDADTLKSTYDAQIAAHLESDGKVSDIPKEIIAGSSYANNLPLLSQMETYHTQKSEGKVNPPEPDYYAEINNIAYDMLAADDGTGKAINKFVNMLNEAKYKQWLSTTEIKLIIDRLMKSGVITPVGANFITSRVI